MRGWLALQGLLVGLLTGIAGVGGGFAIVPALVLVAGLPMPMASGTSLLLIVVNALVALAGLGRWPSQSLPLLLPLLSGGAAGALIGQHLAPRLSERRLRGGFAALLVGSALLTGLEGLHRQGASWVPSQRITHRPVGIEPGQTAQARGASDAPCLRDRSCP